MEFLNVSYIISMYIYDAISDYYMKQKNGLELEWAYTA